MMNLLVFTQKVDKNDPILGFFHSWLEHLSQSVKNLTVVCLEKGEHSLPDNVQVFSLGKEEGRSRIKYVYRFYLYLWTYRKMYDKVFVHMNQEYVLLGGIIWKILGKKIFLWRNHPMGSPLTVLAVLLSNRVLYTSPFSYTARWGRSMRMPVGIDTDFFKPLDGTSRDPRSILFLGRIAPIKKPDIFIQALRILKKKNTVFSASMYGDPLPKDGAYYQSLKSMALELGGHLTFYGSVPNTKTPEIYNRHGIFVNLTPSGSFDKTILEAAACGTPLVISNESLKGDIDEDMITTPNPESVAECIGRSLAYSEEERMRKSKKLRRYVVEHHSMDALMSRLRVVFEE